MSMKYKNLFYVFLLLFISETLNAQQRAAMKRHRTFDRTQSNRSLELSRPESLSVRHRSFLENNPKNTVSHNSLDRGILKRSNQDILIDILKRSDSTPKQIELATKLEKASLLSQHDFISATIRAWDRITDPKKVSDLIKILDDAQRNLSITDNNYNRAIDIALFRNGYQKDTKGNYCI